MADSMPANNWNETDSSSPNTSSRDPAYQLHAHPEEWLPSGIYCSRLLGLEKEDRAVAEVEVDKVLRF